MLRVASFVIGHDSFLGRLSMFRLPSSKKLLLVASLCLVVFSVGVSAEPPQAGRQKWEYRVVSAISLYRSLERGRPTTAPMNKYLDLVSGDVERELNKFGDEGWELVSGGERDAMLVFKRPK
jgi:hypothetical protein